jgi:hypothetical protein
MYFKKISLLFFLFLVSGALAETLVVTADRMFDVSDGGAQGTFLGGDFRMGITFLGKNIGYAMLALPWTNLGTDLTVESPDAERAATVVEKPYVDPKKTLARAS